MIWMKAPSLAINSHDVPGPNYRMWRSVDAKEGFQAATLASHIASANQEARQRFNTPLMNVIINCHGASQGGAIYIGGEKHDRRRAPSAVRANTMAAAP